MNRASIPLEGFNDLAIDSRHVKPGCLFFAIVGTSRDAHDHLDQAVKAGASGLVVSKPEKVPPSFEGKVFVVEDVRVALSEVCSRFFGGPDKKLKLLGVTGTNGKTTSVYMLEHLLGGAGLPTAVLGTIDHHFESHVWESQLTTPDILSLYRRLSEVLGLGAKAVAMEISSHALDQKRVRGLDLDIGIWTNFTRDHLDYHKTEAAYFEAKRILFDENLKQKQGISLLNADDPSLGSVLGQGGETYFFGTKGDFRFNILEKTLSHSRFLLNTPFGAEEFFLPTPGLHNVYNATGALAASLCLGLPMGRLQSSLAKFFGAPGRLEKIANSKGKNVFVDYAHTPDAIRSSLSSLKELLREGKSRGKLWIVFGFGGDRDRGKRPLMVEEALKLADVLVLTSDNPRTEDPQQIVNDGLVAVSKFSGTSPVHVELNRSEAIAFALQSATEDDVILIAGKGHENYQIVGDQVLPFSDKGCVLENLK